MQDYDITTCQTKLQRVGDIKTNFKADCDVVFLRWYRMTLEVIKNQSLDPNHDVCGNAPVRPSLQMIQIEIKDKYTR